MWPLQVHLLCKYVSHWRTPPAAGIGIEWEKLPLSYYFVKFRVYNLFAHVTTNMGQR